MVVTLGQQYNIGEKPTVILYTYINRHAGTPKKRLTKKNIVVHTTTKTYTKTLRGTWYYDTVVQYCTVVDFDGSFVLEKNLKASKSYVNINIIISIIINIIVNIIEHPPSQAEIRGSKRFLPLLMGVFMCSCVRVFVCVFCISSNNWHDYLSI